MAQSGTKIAATRITRKGATIHKTNERPGTRAEVRYVRVSAYKAREVLDLIRGKHVNDADEILQLVERDVAIPIRKLLASAIANAMNNDSQDPDTLFVAACFADEGPTLKRWRPRSRGRASRIRKRTCHITIIVARLPEAELARRAERDAQAGPAAGGRRRTARQAASRRARVARSRQAEDHDHDHDHDHDDEVAEESPYTGSVVADESGEAPEGFEIKGNEDSKKYHVPGSQWYDQTQPEVWFATADDAEAAGFVPAGGEAAQDVAEEPEADEPAGSVDDAIEAQTSPENSAAEPTDVDATADGDTDSPEDAAAEDEKKDED